MKHAFMILIIIGIHTATLSSVVAETGTVERTKKGAPRVVLIDSLADRYGGVIFHHEKHVSVAGRCSMCHHEHGNYETPVCRECHTLGVRDFRQTAEKGFLPCGKCHGTFNPEHPSMPGLKVAYHRACLQCHRGIANVGQDPKGCTELCHWQAQHGKQQASVRK
jgi:hypothetical protein